MPAIHHHSKRHARLYAGHPRLPCSTQDVDGRDKPGHDDKPMDARVEPAHDEVRMHSRN
jgi:hypothetical protein